MRAKLSKKQARSLTLSSQLLRGRLFSARTKECIAQTIEHLGYIQIDTISVVERAHHHTLWARCPDFHPDMLHELQAVDRRIFEYWGHAASFLPVSDYRFYIPRMKRFRSNHTGWEGEWHKKYKHLLDPVLNRIRTEGPLSSKDFAAPDDKPRGPWWDWKPAKAALELLFWRGDLMVTERRNFQRVYDLTERVLPSDVDTSEPDENELGEYLVMRALNAHGVVRQKDIVDHIRAAKKPVVLASLKHLLETNRVAELDIEHVDKGPWFTRETMIDTVETNDTGYETAYILSPFDNLIIQRDRLGLLFDFDYTLECYVPKAKRKYGYFTLPILYGDRFIARIDPKADRKTNNLILYKVLFENPNPSEKELDAMAEALIRFMRFNRCKRIVTRSVIPGRLRSPLTQRMRELMSVD
jgi:uncharacterized protein YcaQ